MTLWSELSNFQLGERALDNDLDVMKNIFEMKASPRLSVLDVATCGTSLVKSTLVSIHTLVNHRTQRQRDMDKACSTQNNSIPCTFTDSTTIDNICLANNCLSPTDHTDLDHSNMLLPNFDIYILLTCPSYL